MEKNILYGTNLSEKEKLLLAELARCRTNREIAEIMQIKIDTVRNKCTRIYKKLGVTCRQSAVIRAIEKGILCE